MAEPDYLYLTTTGHKTGNPHEIEIWFVEYAQRYYLISERRERSHWVQNIQNNPAVSVRIGDRQTGTPFTGTGRLVEKTAEPDLAREVAALMNAKYNWSDGLIVELTPETPNSAQ